MKQLKEKRTEESGKENRLIKSPYTHLDRQGKLSLAFLFFIG
ncbi:hypothetical protein SAMN05518670_5734 [Paenibacillus sp. OK076]|nr:hypothetical protein SAMN05518670_5734 [Paenibacillus sp. OK076]